MATNLNLMEVTCSRGNTKDSFQQGVQDYTFSIGYPNAINFSRSYFRIDAAIVPTNAFNVAVDNGPLPAGALITFADNAAGNLYSNGFVKFNGQDVSSITSFMPQASALKKRLMNSQPWMQSMEKVLMVMWLRLLHRFTSPLIQFLETEVLGST